MNKLLKAIQESKKLELQVKGSQYENEQKVINLLDENNISFYEGEFEVSGVDAEYYQFYVLENGMSILVQCSGYYGGGKIYLEESWNILVIYLV